MSEYDVVVIGGGAAGLSAGVALSRARRSVLVLDAGEPRNAPAGHVHNYLAREGTPPADLLAAGRAEVQGYGGEVRRASAAGIAQQDGRFGFRVQLDDGTAVDARRVLVATGLVDRLPDVPGVAERWGTDVLHCPYCHGWEVRDQPIGVLGDGPMAVHQALMWRQWTDDVVLFLHRAPEPSAEERDQLAARRVRVVEGEVAAVEFDADGITGIRLASGEVVPRRAVVVAPRFDARADVLTSLGLEPEPLEANGYVIGTYVPADASGATAVPGVWVAGNVTDLKAQVVVSAAAGLTVGAAINTDLIVEDTRIAVDEARTVALSMFDEAPWEERYRSAPAIWSGQPNRQVVAEAADLQPGRALDVGCGEGADAIWLADRGWQVTAVDFSTTALARGAVRADDRGVAARTEWVHADLRAWTPPAGAFDLVSAQFVHLPGADRRALFARLADAVAPGGTLLIVGHHGSDMNTAAHRVPVPGMFFSAEEVAESLAPGEWEILVADARPRPALDHEGQGISVRDAVLRARRSQR